MQIQWYPGHMYKANQEIQQALPKIDLIIEVLDARIPFSSQNPMLSTFRENRPCIRILHKNDLADPAITRQWQKFIEQDQGVKTIVTSTQQSNEIKKIISLCHKLLPEKTASQKIIHSLIFGIPNVGKSTLINILAGRVIAKTGNEPAVTKRQQRITLTKNLVLSDTPGMLWPNVENKNSGYRLAATGAIKDTAIQYADIAFFIAEFLLQHYPEQLKNRYQLTQIPANETELVELIGQKRGCLRAGKQVDTDKTAKILLNELRSGLLGQITLETPAMIQLELDDLAVLQKRKAAKKMARKQLWKSR